VAAVTAPEPRVLVPLAIRGEPPAWGQLTHALQGQSMGTTWSVRCVGPSELRLEAITRAIDAALADVVAQMSHWEPGSELSRFNAAPAGHVQRLPPAFATVMDAALRVAAASDGAYDPAAGELVALWGFGPAGLRPRHDEPGFTLPGDADIAAARRDWRALCWDAGTRCLTQPGGLRLDLSAIAKGHAVDRVCDVLADCGLPNHLVEIGGELRGAGLKPDAHPWWVALEPPAPDCGLAPTRIALHGLAIATSGDYRRCFIDTDGRRRPHTLDPRTGRPIEHGIASVSVVHDSAMWADAWSTALTVLGPVAGLDLAVAHGIAAQLVWRDADGRFVEAWTPALQDLSL
jgi:thiamine biosynthesis lipoprotein